MHMAGLDMGQPLPSQKPLPAQGDTTNSNLSPAPWHQLQTTGMAPGVPPHSHETSWRYCLGVPLRESSGCQAMGEQVVEQGSSYLSKGQALHASCPNKGTVMQCKGPGTPHWRQSRAKRALGADSVPSCQVSTHRPHMGLASKGPCSWHGKLGGCFHGRARLGERSGEGVHCMLKDRVDEWPK